MVIYLILRLLDRFSRLPSIPRKPPPHTPPQAVMSVNPTLESSDLKKLSIPEVVEDVPLPTYDTVDLEAANPRSTPSEFRPASRVKTFFLTALYTAAFTITTLMFCLHGLVFIGSPYNERLEVFERGIYASIFGSIILGPMYFTNQSFMTFAKARNEVINIHMTNGRLIRAFRDLALFCAVVVGAVVSAATLGSGLVFWPLVHSNDPFTKNMAVDAALTPIAGLFGGLRWSYEVIGMMIWTLVRIPRISTGLEGDKYENLIKIACVFVPSHFSIYFLM